MKLSTIILSIVFALSANFAQAQVSYGDQLINRVVSASEMDLEAPQTESAVFPGTIDTDLGQFERLGTIGLRTFDRKPVYRSALYQNTVGTRILRLKAQRPMEFSEIKIGLPQGDLQETILAAIAESTDSGDIGIGEMIQFVISNDRVDASVIPEHRQ